jgi:hypothetical protein
VKRLLASLAGLAAVVAAAVPAPTPTPASTPAASIGCVDCHLALDDASVTPPAKAFADDIHARSGFTCASCHGGDPRTEDQEAAHDPRKGFRGKPSPRDIPALCGTCHADAAAMRQFNPSLRVDCLRIMHGARGAIAGRSSRVGSCRQHAFSGRDHVADSHRNAQTRNTVTAAGPVAPARPTPNAQSVH